MSLCHSENVFPEHHINVSGLWESANHTSFNESELYNFANVLQSTKQTQSDTISGFVNVHIPFIPDANDSHVPQYKNISDSSNGTLAWETKTFIENAWDHLNETTNQTKNVIESAWNVLDENDSKTLSFGIPLRKKELLLSPNIRIKQHQLFLLNQKKRDRLVPLHHLY